MQNLGLKNWENLGTKLKFWTPLISSVRNLQLSVRKLQLIPALPIVLTHDAAGQTILECFLVSVYFCAKFI